MAVTLGKSPVIMTAAADEIGNDGKHWAVTNIRYVTTGTDGACVILDKSGGRDVARFAPPGANAEASIDLGGEWYDGFYIDSIAAGGRVYLYYR